MIFKQFNFDGCLAYIIACEQTKERCYHRPFSRCKAFSRFVASHSLTIEYVIDTHTHVDHVSIAPELADILGAKTVMSRFTPLQREMGSK